MILEMMDTGRHASMRGGEVKGRYDNCRSNVNMWYEAKNKKSPTPSNGHPYLIRRSINTYTRHVDCVPVTEMLACDYGEQCLLAQYKAVP